MRLEQGSQLRNPWVDAVRIFACLWVVMFHWQGNGGFFPALLTKPQVDLAPLQVQLGRGGFLGVDIFFILSGFVIANSLRGRTPRQFLTARFLRLYPTYLVASLLVLTVIPCSITAIPGDWEANLLSFFWLQYPLNSKYFLGAAWSLEFEINFYLAVALMILLGKKYLPNSKSLRKWLVLSTLLVSLVYFSTQTRLCASGCEVLEPVTFFFSLGGFAPYFVLGAMISRLGRVRFTGLNSLILFLSGTLTIYSILARVGFSHLVDSLLAITLCATAVLVLALGQFLAVTVRPTLYARLRQMALLTYPTYLLHETFGLSIVSIMVRSGVPSGTAYALAGAGVLAVSTVLVTHVDTWLTQRLSG